MAAQHAAEQALALAPGDPRYQAMVQRTTAPADPGATLRR
jgi:hypothetical protein